MSKDIVAWHFVAELPQPHGRSLRNCYALGVSRDEAANRISLIHPHAAFERSEGVPLTDAELREAIGLDYGLGAKVFCLPLRENM